MTSRDLSRFSAVLAGLLMAAVSFAQQNVLPRKSAGPAIPTRNPNQVVGRPDYGTTGLTYVRATGIQFTPYNGGPYTGLGGSVSRYPTADFSMDAGVSIPSGAIVDYLEFDYYDTNASDFSLSLLDCGPQGAACNVVTGVGSTGTGGLGVVSVSGLNYTVTNGTNSLDLNVSFGALDGTQAVLSGIVGYRLQVSPAPGVATFGDVAVGSTYFQFIEALAASGITAGCDAVPNYCPDRQITRAEMAVFLAKALGLHFPN